MLYHHGYVRRIRTGSLVLPGRLGLFAALPFKRAEAADGQSADGIRRLAAVELQKFRPHADGKLEHADFARFGGQEMPELMEKNARAEKQNADHDQQDDFDGFDGNPSLSSYSYALR